MDAPEISVVMSVYNGAAYVADAIESVLAQTEPRFEFIILDDGSTDESPEIVRRFAERDPRIRFICDGTNQGIAPRLNQGLELATAPLIARMDADDISHPDRFALQLDFLNRHPDVVLVGSRVIIIDPEGDELWEMGDALTHREIDNGLMKRVGQLVYHPSVVYRKEAAFAVGCYDTRFRSAEDLDFFLKLAEIGRIENLRRPLIKYREHLSKIGFTRCLEQEQEVDAAIAAAHVRRGTAPDPRAAPLPCRTPESTAAIHRKWGWWALNGGKIAAARKHAWRALTLEPGAQSARLLYCAMRGR